MEINITKINLNPNVGGGNSGGGGSSSGKIGLPNGICFKKSTFTEFDMGEYDWSNVHLWEEMFKSCNNLTTLKNIPHNIIATESISDVFSYCENLTSLDLSGWDTKYCTNGIYMFANCKSLESINVSGWDVSSFKQLTRIFSGCENLTSIDLTGWNPVNCTNTSYMFTECRKLVEVKMDGDYSNVTNAASMFSNIKTTGTFYYNPQYDYSKIIAQLPSTWTAVPIE